jgi:hypothetical protein
MTAPAILVIELVYQNQSCPENKQAINHPEALLD